jgi:phage antirepressor YoqD-like protein
MTSEIQIKKVDFNGDELIAIKDERTGDVFTGIKNIFRSIGFDDDSMKHQLRKWKEDIVVNKGIQTFTYPDPNGKNRETFCISAKRLPIALAKISITPTMTLQNPGMIEKLESYQETCSDILYDAFNENKIPQSFSEALLLAGKIQQEKEQLEKEAKEKQKQIDIMQPKAKMYDIVMNTEPYISVRVFAKIVVPVKNKKIYGQNSMFEWLRNNKFLMEGNEPYQQYVSMGIFISKLVKTKSNMTVKQTYITKKGMQYVCDKLENDGFTININKQEIDSKKTEEFVQLIEEHQTKKEKKKVEKRSTNQMLSLLG